MSRRTRHGTDATADAFDELSHADPARSLVMAYFNQLVIDGLAEWDMLANGDIRLCFPTGETFLLAETVIIRLA
ncbi:hypothetical protein [Rhizobium sp. 1399]|uniref:hypothetical protein n=1 Tax=Rhizobium sp. 1399 TaxID=2817758 RepID=UPI00285D97BD|nr:hypothetical protein [Rhizobium sp. 1399]MDR6667112.1 hypothetical protein [Rhizobium sp. 1399]